MKRGPYTFLTFTSAAPAHAIERHPDNPALWRTLCGMAHHRTTGQVIKGAKRCQECKAEIRRRSKYVARAR